MRAQVEYDKLIAEMAWLQQQTVGVSLPADERALLAIGCFDVAIEHQASVALLYLHGLYGSAFALLRVLAESLVRGMWLRHCASDSQLQQFRKSKLDRSFQELIDDVEQKLPALKGILSRYKSMHWKALNGFTHTGIHQVSRRHTPGKVENNYSDDDLVKLLKTANALGFMAHSELVEMTNRPDLVAAVIAHHKANLKKGSVSGAFKGMPCDASLIFVLIVTFALAMMRRRYS